ncbi:vicilin-like seed storage protein At2g28490 [Cajanus cajan]|uniref:Vicilin-like antimicrobial peptides 2-2 n=1 Tax=Cajanus cajan TaxID=3821 RepID=A0A151SV05_CAJCA|nr:vicilin-like seed storage protein At2g28490 [Cajanus cajan]KYP58624.1 Vicilin-like antimicrobial peptides 2-2 [Cajanus cajan]
MGSRVSLLILFLVLCHSLSVTMGRFWRKEVEEREDPDKLFLMLKSKRVAKTDAGEMRVLESYGGRVSERSLHIGFITMEPRSLFVPQYLDSTMIIFLRSGEAKVGFIYRDRLAERHLKMGDVYQIPAGSAFYLVNMEDQKLDIICSIDPSESLGVDIFQSFYIGGGAHPASVLSGFEPEILEAAFNASGAELRKLFTRQYEGPIVHVGDSHATSIWTKFLELKEEDKLEHMREMMQEEEEEDEVEEEEESGEEEEQQTRWSWRKLLETVFGDEAVRREKGTRRPPRSCNLYERKPDFENRYGWSVAIDGSHYFPLKRSGVGLYHVNLSAGSMMAPHMNPRATEYGIVLKGTGRIQIVFPNGSNAMDAEIKEGDVFFIPRYFAFCQMASRGQPLEFFGFTTSAQRNRPQFLVGATSLMRTMLGPELAAAFGVTQETMRRVANAQHEALILPITSSSSASHSHFPSASYSE